MARPIGVAFTLAWTCSLHGYNASLLEVTTKHLVRIPTNPKNLPSMHEETITNWEYFQRQANSLKRHWVFRGQSDREWPLRSSLTRICIGPVGAKLIRGAIWR
jgi:hypothetical protein